MYVFGMRPCPIEKAFPGKKKDPVKGQLASLTAKVTPVKVDRNDGSQNSPSESARSAWKRLAAKATEDATTKSDSKDANENEKWAPVFAQEANLKQIVEDAMFLNNEENMEFLWRFFAQFIDRVLFYVYTLTSAAVFTWFVVAQ